MSIEVQFVTPAEGLRSVTFPEATAYRIVEGALDLFRPRSEATAEVVLPGAEVYATFAAGMWLAAQVKDDVSTETSQGVDA